MRRVVVLAVTAWAALSWSCDDHSQPRLSYDASRARRVFRPPPDHVRPVPPHAIHARGVGPYELGMSLQDIFDLLPFGPRAVLTQIDDVVDHNLVRADSEALVIGVTRHQGVVFVSVLDDRIARTDGGVGVGTTLEELQRLMGPPLEHVSLAMDPRMVAFARMPNLRFILQGQGDNRRVAAVIVRHLDSERMRQGAAVETGTAPAKDIGAAPEKDVDDQLSAPAPDDPVVPGKPASTGASDADRRDCNRDGLVADRDRILATARISREESVFARVVFGCFASAGDAVVATRSTAVLVAHDSGRLRRLSSHTRPGIVYVAPVDVDRDGRDELAVVSEQVSVRERTSHVEILRYESGKLTRIADRQMYRISNRNAAWVGADLHGIDLLLELWADPDDIHITGVYVQRDGTRPTNVALLLPVDVPIRRQRPATSLAVSASRDGGALPTGDARPPVPPPEPRDAGTTPATAPADVRGTASTTDRSRPGDRSRAPGLPEP